MTPDLIAYIRTLTAQDTKTLSQKALKTVEEVGDMAKCVLPFENAAGTTHRFVERRRIMEEAVDTVLCSLSVAFDLGFSDEEVLEMFWAKANKWGSLQARESGMRYPVPFELHVTVASAASAQAFRQACQELEVKPIFLALQDGQGETVLHDVMTSSIFLGDNRGALDELERIAKGLSERGLEVVRRKIETVPWHPAAPALSNGVSQMPPGGYFEAHFNVLVESRDDKHALALREQLFGLVHQHGAHLSRNVYKQLSARAFTVMATLRSYSGTREDFDQRRDALAQALQAQGFKTEKLITEFSLFDSKGSHDASWLAACAR